MAGNKGDVVAQKQRARQRVGIAGGSGTSGIHKKILELGEMDWEAFDANKQYVDRIVCRIQQYMGGPNGTVMITVVAPAEYAMAALNVTHATMQGTVVAYFYVSPPDLSDEVIDGNGHEG